MAVTKETLWRIVTELPALPWAERDLTELLTPGAGVITGFQEFVEEAKALAAIDLDDTPPAEGLQAPRKTPR